MVKTVIAVAECKSYNSDTVAMAMKDCLSHLGGLDSIISSDDKVLLKPNMLQAALPEENVTTHPAIVEAVAQEVLDRGATPLIGDSPGGKFKDMEKFWKLTGFKAVSEKLDVELVNFESAGFNILKRNGRKYPICKTVLESDVVINLPKIKTHSLTIFTCALKNMYGSVPGLSKVDFHRKNPKPYAFSERVVDIYALSKPNLTLVDGLCAMEGAGPSGGDAKPLNMILSSRDGLALDTYICHILGMTPSKVASNRIAIQQGLGEGDINNMDIRGWQPPIIDDFKWPSNIYYSLEMVPSSLARAIMKLWWSRPAINQKKCQNCNVCVESCPVESMQSGALVPEINYEHCINCLCCMEFCPHQAFYENKSSLYSFISRFLDSDKF